MSRFLYYLIILPFSRLPLYVLYLLSNGIYYWLCYIIRYRKKVVLTNISNAFPAQSHQWHLHIARNFYRHLSDLFIESIKLFSLTKAEGIERFQFNNTAILAPYAQKGQDIILVAGHYANWELGGIMAHTINNYQSYVIINPLNDTFINKKFQSARARFGVKLVPRDKLHTALRAKHQKPKAYILLADQSPTYDKKVLWLDFLNQPTAVTLGPEILARRFGYPVFWVSVKQVERGRYEATLERITDQSSKTPPNEITLRHVQKLESLINENPAYWLWSHRRWKRKPP